jgi:hypothetical protein
MLDEICSTTHWCTKRFTAQRVVWTQPGGRLITPTFIAMRICVKRVGQKTGGRLAMIVRARSSFLSLLFLLSACGTADRASVYRNADIDQMPRDLEALNLVKTDDRLAEISTPVLGHRSVIRYMTTSLSVPLINDSALRRTIVIVFEAPSPQLGRHKVGQGTLVAYIAKGPPSRPVGAYCLGMATNGFVDIKEKYEGIYDVDFDLKFSEISAANFKDVCDEDHIVKSLRNLRQEDLIRPASSGDSATSMHDKYSN